MEISSIRIALKPFTIRTIEMQGKANVHYEGVGRADLS
jgi:hypothetical protein